MFGIDEQIALPPLFSFKHYNVGFTKTQRFSQKQNNTGAAPSKNELEKRKRMDPPINSNKNNENEHLVRILELI